MLRLFVGTVSTCSLASHIALEEAGAAYEVSRLNFAQNEQRSADYLKINPKGRVPALLTDRGILTETPAILTYIAQMFPAAGLAPQGDPFELARLQAFTAWLCSTVHPNHAHGSRGARWSDDPAVIAGLKVKVPQNMTENFLQIETDYLQGPWVMGERYSVADCYLYTVACWLEGDGVDVSRLPRVLDHRARVAARPAVKRVRNFYG